MSGQKETPSPFWTFSLRIYGAPGVPPACLLLQESSGVDVNVLLFCLFAASRGRRLSVDDARALVAAVDEWKTGVVVPLRLARIFLKTPPATVSPPGALALRERVKALELEAERLQQEALFAAFDMTGFGVVDAAVIALPCDNVRAYESALGASFDSSAVETLSAAFQTIKDVAA